MTNATVLHRILQSGEGWFVIYRERSFNGYVFERGTSFVVPMVGEGPQPAVDPKSLESLRQYTARGKLAVLSNGDAVFVTPGTEAGIPEGVTVVEVRAGQ